MKKFIAVLASLLCLAGCNKQGADWVTISEIVNVQGPVLINDAGVRYSVSNSSMLAQIQQLQRVYVTGQIEPASSAQYDYILYLNEFVAVDVLECVKQSEATEETGLGDDPANLAACWIDGGYINAIVTFSFRSSTGYLGLLNLVYDDQRSTQDHLYFTVSNNQDGKTWENMEVSEADLAFGSAVYSFPYTSLLDPAFKGTVNFHFEWKWFQKNDNNLSVPLRTTEPRSETLSIKIE